MNDSKSPGREPSPASDAGHRGDENAPQGSRREQLSVEGSARRRFLVETGALTGGLAAAQYTTASAQGADRADQAVRPGRARSATFTINNREYAVDLEPPVTLLDMLRENLGMTGTKKGCDRGQCGACTVLVNGRRVNSCLTLALSVEGAAITTVEGLATEATLHPVQQAFIEQEGFQCGYCTPGQICSAVGMLSELRAGDASVVTRDLSRASAIEISDDEIRERMSGNLCRCGAYVGIVGALRLVVQRGA